MCLKNQIRSKVARYYIKHNKTNMDEYYEDVEKLWQETTIYKKVLLLLNNGMDIDEVETTLEKQGIII